MSAITTSVTSTSIRCFSDNFNASTPSDASTTSTPADFSTAFKNRRRLSSSSTSNTFTVAPRLDTIVCRNPDTCRAKTQPCCGDGGTLPSNTTHHYLHLGCDGKLNKLEGDHPKSVPPFHPVSCL